MAALVTVLSASAAPPQGSGGFVVETDRTAVFPWTPGQMQSFLPERGRFTFPAPYGTEGIRITNASDCGGSDCVEPVGGASWRNIDAHSGRKSMLIFLGLRAVGPTLFRYDKGTGRTENLGPLFEAGSPFAARSGEGWYFSARRPATLYLTSGPRLLRYDVLARTFETVLDATTEFGDDREIGPAYSSDDDNVHSATLRDSAAGAVLGCLAYREDLRRFSYHPANGALAGCEVDKSGRWLVIKENADGVAGVDNRIVDLETGAETLLPGGDGAGGPSANGAGFIIAADNGKGGVRVWSFDQDPPQGELVYGSGSADAVVGAIAHSNAGAGVPLAEQSACAFATTTRTPAPASEIVCFPLDASGEARALAPSMPQPDAALDEKAPPELLEGNLDVTGRYFLWVSRAGDRKDAFIVKAPEPVPAAGQEGRPPGALTCPTSPVARGATFATTVTAGSSPADRVTSYRVGAPRSRWLVPFRYVHVPRPATVNTNAPNRLGDFELRLLANNTYVVIGSCTYQVTTTGDTTPPQISGVVAANITATAATITWTTDEPADTQIDYGTTTAYGSSTPLDPSLVVAHSQVVSGLTSGTLYHYRVKSRDAVGNLATSADFTFATLDTTPPSVSITAPVAGAIVSGTVTVAASASDNVGVVGVQFKLDGANLGAEDTTSPYSVSWNTLGVPNGSHTLTAVARDAAGNTTTSAPVTVTVTNDTTPPSVSITAPVAGAIVSGTVTVAANASDNVGVVGVQFKLDGANLGAEDTTSPYSVPWNTLGVPNGSHTLTAVARDAAGNATTSAPVTVTVANAGVVVLTPQDTYINLDALNQSTDPQLKTYTWPANKVANAILMKFDFSSIPAGAVPTDATLMLALVASDATPDATYAVAAHKIVGKNPVITAATGFTADGVIPWTANPCCFNNVPLAQADLSPAYDTQAIDKTVGFKSWTITAMVQEWLAVPAANFGVLLNSDASKLADRYRLFASMEHADPSLRPSLRVTYTIPPPDPIPPTVSITAPLAGAVVSGTITVSATASDNVGVVSVQFKLDGANLGPIDTTAPYSVSWNTATASPGPHTLTAVARDAAGNSTTSAPVPVTVVDNTPPVITGVMASVITSTSALISWNTNELSDSQVDYGLTSGYGSSTPLNVTLVTSHTVALAGLSPNTLYHYRARSRDAAGNLALSPDFTFTTTAGGGGGVVFESNWATATGNSDAALRDGGRWTWTADWGGGQLLTVVPGGPAGHNALRVQQRGETFAADVQVDNFMSLSTDYYVRFYMRNDDTSGSGDHIVTPDIYNYANLTYIRKRGGPSSWQLIMSMYACEATYPLIHWSPAANLPNGQWYRFEYYIHYVNVNHIQVHPRVYNAAGALVLSDADFRQEDYGSAQWNGRSDWTLASYYAGGYSFCVYPTWLNDFAMGNNGQQGATDTGLYWYYAALQIRTDTWPGPVTGSADSTPPTVSMTAPPAGATVSGTTPVSANASDNVGVVGVQFKLDGVNLGAEDTASPYSISWDTTTAANGPHTLTAVARDAAGNQATSAGRNVTVSNPIQGGIAALYPGDVGIEAHPDVVFVERFEEATLPDLFARWTDIQNPPAAPLAFSADAPLGSPGTKSLDVSWAGGSQDTAGLYKLLSPGVNDTLHVRYYIKYPVNGLYRHEGIWMGGNNPPLTWPNPQAGIRPVGNDRFIAAAEQWDDRSRFDHYDYWMNMRMSGDGMFWGNLLLNDPAAQVNVGQWTCVEHMVKLNNPTTAFNGQHAIWLDGDEISHLGQGFPPGFWTNAIFTQDPAGSPFEGFRWRSDTNLNLNWIWLLVYAPDDPPGFTGHIKYDHVVIAKSYIGCLAP